LPIEHSQVGHPPSILNFFTQPSIGSSAPSYPGDSTSYYPTAQPHLFGGIDVRSRLNSNSASSSGSGMAHTHPHRPATLPHPGQPISTRDQYATATPSFRRPAEHSARSPPFPPSGIRRQPASPAPNVLPGFAPPVDRMDSSHFGPRPSQSNTPPLSPTEILGTLQYADSSATPIGVEISGTIDKGFFQSDGEWTCYRRNYFACACSFTLDPHYPSMPIQFTPSDASRSSQTFQIYRFAMCISAVVADNDQHEIELIQHTPKRDKGPTAKPERVMLAPKQNSGSSHSLNMYGDHAAIATGRGLFPETGFVSSQSGTQGVNVEHTFERIQFKQATQNNGKRRAAQQYYHLMLELWADVGNPQSNGEQFVKVATRKSAKMIVRGRSPGHYQNERRGSHSSGPGGSTGPIGSYPGMGGMGDFANGPMMNGPGGYSGAGYDARQPMYGIRHHEVPAEVAVPPDDEKAMQVARGYQYFPGSLYGAPPDRVAMYAHRSDSQGSGPHMPNGMDLSGRMGSEGEMSSESSRFFHPPAMMNEKGRCRDFEGRASSNGYYPTMSEPSEMNITMT
jgi:meiosis-specific transcription factor NDT80